MIIRFCLIILVLIQSGYSLTLESYFSNLYKRFEHSINQKFNNTLERIHTSKNVVNEHKESISKLLFYHMLFTTTDAVNGQKGGILQIPYFWHWMEPNPRYDITFTPENLKLNKVSPPVGYERYKTYGDVDRTPFIYLQNLVEDNALFNHPLYDSFYTFGWCSEREMAFAALLNILGYESKIIQEGIHVWTEVLLKGEKNDYLIVTIDNTFNGFQVERLNTSKEAWEKDFGSGAQVAWYNKKADSQKELLKIKSIEVGELAQKRIDGQISLWLKK